jgi:hypothetical protein
LEAIHLRNLSEIIEECKTNGKPDYEELRYSVLVLISMLNIDHSKLKEALAREKESPKFIKDLQLKNSHDMYRTALSKSPKEYLGWNNDPENPEYQKFHKLGNKLIDKVIKNMENNE